MNTLQPWGDAIKTDSQTCSNCRRHVDAIEALRRTNNILASRVGEMESVVQMAGRGFRLEQTDNACIARVRELLDQYAARLATEASNVEVAEFYSVWLRNGYYILRQLTNHDEGQEPLPGPGSVDYKKAFGGFNFFPNLLKTEDFEHG